MRASVDRLSTRPSLRRIKEPGRPQADVAVCTLSELSMVDPLVGHPRVAVAGTLATANLGVEQLILGVLALPAIRHLIVCGRDSRLFRPGQSLLSLATRGFTEDGSIIGALGFRPRLASLRPAVITEFRRRIIVHDMLACTDPREVLAMIDTLPCPLVSAGIGSPGGAGGSSGPAGQRDQCARLAAEMAISKPRLVRLPARGRRIPVAASGRGYFVVSPDPPTNQIVLRHYCEDLTSGHELRSHSAQALLLGAVSHGLVDDLTHAGYLGGELAKAEAALRLGLGYVQDRPLSMGSLGTTRSSSNGGTKDRPIRAQKTTGGRGDS
ncbi:MAG: hypothetical protein WAK86_04250 [Pseudonocardiaceae bacterium]